MHFALPSPSCLRKGEGGPTHRGGGAGSGVLGDEVVKRSEQSPNPFGKVPPFPKVNAPTGAVSAPPNPRRGVFGFSKDPQKTSSTRGKALLTANPSLRSPFPLTYAVKGKAKQACQPLFTPKSERTFGTACTWERYTPKSPRSFIIRK